MTDLALEKTAKKNIESEIRTPAAILKVLKATFSIARFDLGLVAE